MPNKCLTRTDECEQIDGGTGWSWRRDVDIYLRGGLGRVKLSSGAMPFRTVCYLFFQFFLLLCDHTIVFTRFLMRWWSIQPPAALWTQQNVRDNSYLREHPAQIFQFMETLRGIKPRKFKQFAWWGYNSHVLLVTVPGPLHTSWFFIILCFLVMVIITMSFGWALTTCQVLHMHLVATTILKMGHIILIFQIKVPHSVMLSNWTLKLVSERSGTSVYRAGWRAHGLSTYSFYHITLLFQGELYCHYQNGQRILSHICLQFVEGWFVTKILKPRPLLQVL